MPDTVLKVALVGLNQPGYQSLGLGYVRAYAEAHERLRGRVAFQTLDLTVETDSWWVAYRVLRLAPDLVGFSVACWNAAAIYEACRLIRAAVPSIRIVLGGPEVGPQAEKVLVDNRSVDAVVRGEGEVTFSELLLALLAGKELGRCRGVSAREGGRIVSAEDRAPVDDLDTLPSPYLSGVLSPLPAMSFIETFRGCPHACGYCYEAKGLRGIRSFSRARVQAEIDAIASAPWVETLSFVDSVFNLTDDRLGWLAGILEPHAGRGLRVHTVEVDIERIGPEEAGLLARAGVVSVETGPQTVGERALETCGRTLDPERFSAGIRALRAVGIRVECDLIVGLPGDDAYDIIRAFRWLLELDPGGIQASTLRVLPGTDLARQSDRLGLRFDEEPDHTVVATDSFGFADIRRAEALGLALQAAYQATLQPAGGGR